MAAKLIRVLLSSCEVCQKSIVLNWNMIIIIVVMELRSVTLMNNTLSILWGRRLGKMHTSATTLFCLPWRVHVMTRMVQILLSIEHQQTLQYILFLKRSQCNFFLSDVLFGHALWVVWSEPHIETLWAECWPTDAHWLFSTTGVSAILSILLDWHSWFWNGLVYFGTFFFFIIFNFSWWIKLLNDRIGVLWFGHILLFCFSVWGLILLIECIWRSSDGCTGSNWARTSN